MSKLTLYHYYRSSCSWRVRWALNLKGLDYHPRAINLLQDEQKSAGYLRLNPSGLVPCLVTANGEVIGDSLAILEWLEESYPTPALLPGDPLMRAQVRRLAYTISSGTQPLQNLSAQRFYSADPSAQAHYARHWIDKGLAVYEKLLAASSGTYSCGAQVTLADLCLIPQCYNALRFGLKLDAYPEIQRIYQLCSESQACRLAAPENFPSPA